MPHRGAYAPRAAVQRRPPPLCPVCAPRRAGRGTHDAVDTCGQPGYAARDRARGGAPGALHSKSGLCEPERTPAACPRPPRATGGDADGASPCAAEPCEPRQVGRSSGKRPAPGATRVLGRSHHPRHGRPGRDNACARSLPPVVTPPPVHPAHGVLLRRANGPRSLPLHHMTPPFMKGKLLMSLSSLPPQDAHAPLCAVCHRPLTSGSDPTGPLA